MNRDVLAAIAVDPSQPFVIDTIHLDDPRPDEVVIQLAATGLCHTDLSAKSGKTPFPLPAVLGHEGAGTVVHTGADVTTLSVGDTVVVSFASCGACTMCRDGHPANCREWAARNLQRGTRPDGSTTATWRGQALNANYFGQSSFAEFVLTRASGVVKVPSDLPLALLTSLGCGVQTGVGTVLNVLRPAPEDTLVVYGAGAVGLAAIMGAAIAGVSQIVAVDRVASRLDVALACGATDVVLAGHDGPTPLELTGGVGFDHAVEATGHPRVLEEAIASLAPGGSCAIVGAPAVGTEIAVDVKFLMRGRRLLGVTQGDSDPQIMIPRLVQLYRDGLLPLELITTFYPFSDIDAAVADAVSGASIKAVLTFAAEDSAASTVDGSARAS